MTVSSSECLLLAAVVEAAVICG